MKFIYSSKCKDEEECEREDQEEEEEEEEEGLVYSWGVGVTFFIIDKHTFYKAKVFSTKTREYGTYTRA